MANNMSFIGRDMAVDLGTANTLVYVRGRGIVLNEPSVVAINQNSGGILAVGARGQEDDRPHARATSSRSARSRTASSPTSTPPSGCCATSSRRCTAAVTWPSRASSSACRRASPASSSARSRTPATRPARARSTSSRSRWPRRSASGLPVHEPTGNMVVDIGGGTTEVAVISLGGIVTAQCIRVGGDELDNAIIQYVKKEYSLLLGERTVRRDQDGDRVRVPDAGRAARRDPRPRPRHRSAEDDRRVERGDPQGARGAASTPSSTRSRRRSTSARPSCPATSWTAASCSPAAVRCSAGSTSGCAHETGMPIHIADRPLDCVALGSGKCVEEFEALQQVLVSEPRH